MKRWAAAGIVFLGGISDVFAASSGAAKAVSPPVLRVQPVYLSGELSRGENRRLGRAFDKGVSPRLAEALSKEKIHWRVEIEKTAGIGDFRTTAFIYIPRKRPLKEESPRAFFAHSMRELHGVLTAVKARLGESEDVLPVVVLDNPHLYSGVKVFRAGKKLMLLGPREFSWVFGVTGKPLPFPPNQAVVLMGNANSFEYHRRPEETAQELSRVVAKAARRMRRAARTQRPKTP